MEILHIYPEEPEFLPQARALGEKLGLPTADTDGGMILSVGARGLTLKKENLSLRGDWERMIPRLKPNNLPGEMLVKAAKRVKPEDNLLAVDATAGLGEDSLLLAAAGYRVILFERNPVIAVLLKNALERSREIPELAPFASRMEVREGDSVAELPKLAEKPAVILLDPMFPARQKSSLVTKKLQLFQSLETPCLEEEALMQAALAAGPGKIIVKRPLKGPYLAGVKPGYTLSGKAIRYDCIVPPKKD